MDRNIKRAYVDMSGKGVAHSIIDQVARADGHFMTEGLHHWERTGKTRLAYLVKVAARQSLLSSQC